MNRRRVFVTNVAHDGKRLRKIFFVGIADSFQSTYYELAENDHHSPTVPRSTESDVPISSRNCVVTRDSIHICTRTNPGLTDKLDEKETDSPRTIVRALRTSVGV